MQNEMCVFCNLKAASTVTDSQRWFQAFAAVMLYRKICGPDWIEDYDTTIKTGFQYMADFLRARRSLQHEGGTAPERLIAYRHMQATYPEIIKQTMGDTKCKEIAASSKQGETQRAIHEVRAQIKREAIEQVHSLRDAVDGVVAVVSYQSEPSDVDSYKVELQKLLGMQKVGPVSFADLCKQLKTVAHDLNDQKFFHQLNYTRVIFGLASSTADLAHDRVGDLSRDQLRISAALAAKISGVRMAVGFAHRVKAECGDGLATVFEPPEGSMAENEHRVDTLDDMITNPAAYLETRIAEASACLTKVYTSIERDVVDLTNSIWDICSPKGWELHKDAVLDQPDICQGLLNNPNYKDIGGAIDLLSDMKKHVSSITCDRAGLLLDITVNKKMRDAIAYGTLTVSMTFAIYQVRSHLPGITNDAARATAVDKLKIQLQKRLPLQDLGRSILDGLEALKQPKGVAST